MSATYREKVLEVEPFGIDPIPEQERHGHPGQMFTFWFAISLNVVTWFTGFLGVELGLSLKYAILAIVIGNLTGAAFVGLTSAVGPVLSQPLIPASRRSFGKAGIVGLAFINLLNNLGWLAVNLVLAVMAMQKLLPLGYHVSLLLITAVTLLVALFGYNFIHSFAHWMSILMGILFVGMTVITVHSLPMIAGQATAAPASGWQAGLFVLGIALAFSYQISYCPVGADYSRYFPERTSKKRIWLTSYLGSLSVCVWLEILGALTATLGQQVGPMDFFVRLMGIFTVPALITVILSILPNNVMAIYSSGLAALAMGIPIRRWASVLLTGVLGALLISFRGFELADTYKNFLLLLSYWIAPWLGVVLCDYFYFRTSPGNSNGRNGWAGILAFICGVAVSIPFMSSVLYTGPLAVYLGGADISYWLSMVVSAAIYLVAVIVLKADAVVPARTVQGVPSTAETVPEQVLEC
ncbi:MAG: cytosine permease [Thermacetogeniaceae bacterium]